MSKGVGVQCRLGSGAVAVAVAYCGCGLLWLLLWLNFEGPKSGGGGPSGGPFRVGKQTTGRQHLWRPKTTNHTQRRLWNRTI